MLRKEKKATGFRFVPYGYKYLGPGNPLHSGKPTTIGDKAAQKHDWKYYFLENRGFSPKFQYNEADDDFINEVGTKHTSEWIAKHLFQVKRKFAELGIIDDIRPYQKSKRETSLNDYKQFITPEKVKRSRDFNISPGERIKARRINSSLFNLPPIQDMSESNPNGGSGNAGTGLSETPVDPVPRQIFRGPPDSTFCSLPFYNEYLMSRTCWVHDFAFRPTSVYDCMVDLNSTVDLNPDATGKSTHYITNPTNSSDATVNKARWFDYYASIYKYYHVVACQYEIYVENLTNDNVWVHLMPTNDVYPPIAATNVDMMQWSDCESVALTGRTLAISSTGAFETNDKNANVDRDETMTTIGNTPNFETTNHVINTIGSKAHLFKGVYRTGDYARQIRLDDNVENWTAINTNPTLVERLVLRCKHDGDSWSTSDTADRDRFMRLLIRTKMEYLVEFKELKDGLKYPTNDQPYTATIVTTN